jgi:hypothetical protein
MFRRALKIIAPPVSAERKRLREALASHANAKQALRAATAAVERVRQLLRDAEAADKDAETAESAAAAATQAWAAAGACVDTASADRGLLDRAESAYRRATDARTVANGAHKGLPQIARAADDARIVVGQAADEIKTAVGAVLLAEAEPQFATLERARAQYVEALAELKSLHLITRSWGPAHPYHEFSSAAGSAIASRLHENRIHDFTDNEVRDRSLAWADFAKRLAIDAEAAR